MTLKRRLLTGTDDLFVPDYMQNIYKVLPTALRCMGVRVPREDLLEVGEVNSHLERNRALGARRVIVCLVDSLGIDNMQGTGLGRLFEELGGVTLSSTFPTITSSAITSIHLGVPPTKHGIFGHRVYFPEYGTLVDTLRMAGYGVTTRDAIIQAGINVRALLWDTPIVDLIRQEQERQKQRRGANSGEEARRIARLVYADGLPRQIAGTGLGHFFTSRPNIVPYAGYVDAFGMMRRVLSRYSRRPLFAVLYFGAIDYLAHKYGPNSTEYREECDEFLRQLRAFIESLSPTIAKTTTIIICSDHGQNPLRQERKITFTEKDLEQVKGTLIGPPGYSGRVIHFYCASPTHREKLKQWLKEKAGDRGLILDLQEVEQAGLLPDPLTPQIARRLGDILLICRDGAYARVERPRPAGEKREGLLGEQEMLGNHGSLTAQELYAPFIAFNAQILR